MHNDLIAVGIITFFINYLKCVFALIVLTFISFSIISNRFLLDQGPNEEKKERANFLTDFL